MEHLSKLKKPGGFQGRAANLQDGLGRGGSPRTHLAEASCAPYNPAATPINGGLGQGGIGADQFCQAGQNNGG